jgi:hypothetical protein
MKIVVSMLCCVCLLVVVPVQAASRLPVRAENGMVVSASEIASLLLPSPFLLPGIWVVEASW